MEQQQVVPREDQYVHFLGGLGVSRELWEHARAGKLDELFAGMSYRVRYCAVLYRIVPIKLAGLPDVICSS